MAGLLYISKIIDTVHSEYEFGDNAIHMTTPSLTACGDAFLLYNREEAVLIDTGETLDRDRLLSAIDKANVDAIDVMILTHFDKDHIGGAPAVLEKYPVKTCYTTVGEKDSPEFEALEKSLDDSGTKQVLLTDKVTFECMGASFTIYPPTGLQFDQDEDNNLSLITSVKYGSSALLFTGDAMEERMEQFYERQYDGTDYHFLKVPHHGRDKKIMEQTLEHFHPEAAAITSSRDELEKESLVDLLTDKGVDVFLTRKGRLDMTIDRNHMAIRQKNKVFDLDTGGEKKDGREMEDSIEPSGHSALVINEVGRDGSKKVSWAELYNRSDRDLSLKGYSLTDNKNKLFRYRFPHDITIGGGSCLLVTFDQDKNSESAKEEENTDSVKTKGGGDTVSVADAFNFLPSETLYLAKNGVVMDSFEMPLWVGEGKALGCRQDGEKERVPLSPSPGRVNKEAGQVELVEAPAFSHESGFYDKKFKLSITGSEGCRIYYTTDGSEPDENAQEYKDGILIHRVSYLDSVYSIRKDFAPYYYGDSSGLKPRADHVEDDWYCRYRLPEGRVDKCMVVRAVAVDGQGNRSPVTTASYFVGYGDKPAYKDIAVLSLVTEPEGLFGQEKGIMVNGSLYNDMLLSDNARRLSDPYRSRRYCNSFRGRGRDWERPVHMDYLSSEDGHLLFSQEVGMRLHGNTSRVGGAKKSFNLYARKEYDGHELFQASFFDTGLLSDKVTLMKGDDVRNYYFSKKMWTPSVPTQDYSMVQLFIDGEYWGLYAIQERYVSHVYMETHYNLEEDEYSLAKGTSTGFDIKNGDPDIVKTSFRDVRDFAQNKDLTRDRNYDKLCRMIDMDSYIRAYAGRIYTGDQDWSYFKNQIMLYSDYQWHWIIYDMDSGAGDREISRAEVNTFTSPRLIKRYSLENDELFPWLMKSPRFRARFAAVFMDLANEVFHPDKVRDEMEAFKKKYGAAGMKDNLRYPQDQDIPELIGEKSSKLTDTCDTITKYFQDRYQLAPGYMADYLHLQGKAASVTICNEDRTEGSIQVNTICPEEIHLIWKDEGGESESEWQSPEAVKGEWTGTYYTDYPITLKAIPEEGCRFVRWELMGDKEKNSLSAPEDEESQLNFGGDIRVKAVFERIDQE